MALSFSAARSARNSWAKLSPTLIMAMPAHERRRSLCSPEEQGKSADDQKNDDEGIEKPDQQTKKETLVSVDGPARWGPILPNGLRLPSPKSLGPTCPGPAEAPPKAGRPTQRGPESREAREEQQPSGLDVSHLIGFQTEPALAGGGYGRRPRRRVVTVFSRSFPRRREPGF
jgi:hypothetical protein